jgi:hypothetical protein
MNPSFGADEEDINFTRLIAPKMSKNYILINPDNYHYFFKKYNYFSIINVFNTVNDIYPQDDNIMYVFLVPDLRKKMTKDINYFTVDEKEFILSDYEKDMIIRTLNESGQQLIGTEIKFIQPQIKRYVLNIVLTYYNNFTKENIKKNIKEKLNNYFLNVNRRDIIPRADIITLLKTIKGIDSVNVYFISEENEKAILNGYYTKKIFQYNKNIRRREWVETKQISILENQDPNLGLNEFGDILIEPNELPIIRGGWRDRNNIYYDTDINANLSGLNIFFKDSIEYDLYQKQNNINFKSLL